MPNKSILKYNQKTPRYTSYPTSPQFSEQVSSEDYCKMLSALPHNASLSLYAHIPYCKKLCWYCGCHTKVANHYSAIEKYTQNLLKEIDLVSSHLTNLNQVEHIHFGGGSPNMLNADDFMAIMAKFSDKFNINDNAEIAIELDPRSMSEGKVAAYAKMGVNRASLGVQDFQDRVQKAINRIQPYRVIYDSVKLLREYGIENINLDLMYGLPNQTIEMIEENISYALSFKPTRIAFFGYAHVPQMKKQMRLIDEASLPNAELRLQMFKAGADALRKAGYVAIGLDHFVQLDDSMAVSYASETLKRNFQGYTTDNADALLGFGVSSISKLPQGYMQNILDNIDYGNAVNSGKLPIAKGLLFSENDKFRAEIIERLMCYMQIDLAEICEKYQEDIKQFEDVFFQLKEIQNDGLIELNGCKIKINNSTKQISRYVASLFDEYLQPQKQLHSQVA